MWTKLPEVLQDAGVGTQAFCSLSPGSEPLALFPVPHYLGPHFLICIMDWGMSCILPKFYSQIAIASQAFFSHNTRLSSFLPQSRCWNSSFSYCVLWHRSYLSFLFCNLNIEEEKWPLNELASQSAFRGLPVQHQAQKKGFPGRTLGSPADHVSPSGNS